MIIVGFAVRFLMNVFMKKEKMLFVRAVTFEAQMNRGTAFSTRLPMHPVKTQISLRIRAV